MFKKRKFKMPAAAIVALSFFVLIFVGTCLLCLPISSRSGEVNFMNALFTATTSGCITGLFTVDSYTYWSGFGQAVILILIQVGGLGFITILSLFILYVKKHSSLSQRKLVMQSAGSIDLASVKGLVKIILIGTFSIEFIGAFLLCFTFIPEWGWGEGIWQAVFMSVAAFCNAGFTLTGTDVGNCQPGVAGNLLHDAPYTTGPLPILVVSLLIIIGGLGFFVWGDIVHHGVRVRKYSFHSKIVLTVTGILIVLGWGLFMASEWNNEATIGNESVGKKLLLTFFLSVNPRTAGFGFMDYSQATPATKALTDVLMFIGGSPGSTAGGIKTTTLTVFLLSTIATARRKEDINLYNRRFEHEATAQAGAIMSLYLMVAVVSVFLISVIENAAGHATTPIDVDINLDSILFDVISAEATVGLSYGITPYLHPVSQLILITLMYFGRVGGFTLVLIFSGDKKPVAMARAVERVIIG